MPEREYHDVANIFPLMTNDEFQELCNDIREHGLQLPIVLIDEKILDGRNRYLACEKLGIEPEFVTYTGSDPISYAISANLKRRNLTAGQLGMIGEKAKPLYKKEAARRRASTWTKPGEKVGSEQHLERRRQESAPLEPGEKRSGTSYEDDQAGKAVGVSGKTVQRSGKLRKTASPEVLAAVDSGEMTLNEAIEATQGESKPPPSREKLFKTLDTHVSKVVRLISDLGCREGHGKKVYEAVDALCRRIEGWK